jgi:Kinesin motor domain
MYNRKETPLSPHTSSDTTKGITKMVVSRIIDTSSDIHCNISVESVLRLRPLSKREILEDSIVLEQAQSVVRNGPATVVLNPSPASLASPLAGGMRGRAESDATTTNTPTEYHFHHVLTDSTSQDKIYYTLGLPIATAAMASLKKGVSRSNAAPKSHLVICMGVAGSGKTYTCLGGSSVSKRRASQDGLVPRLVDSLFSQSKHHAGSGATNFSVNISMAQVTHSRGLDPHACVIHDLLVSGQSKISTEQKAKRNNLGVRSMAAKFERVISSPLRSRSPVRSSATEFAELDVENIELAIETCADVTQAREVLQKGLINSAHAAQTLNHHLLIILQPVCNGSRVGDKIAILDMAGLEKGGRKSVSHGKDSVANKNQEASAAVLHCLRTMMHNTNIRNGTSNPLDIIDDEISEISAVSQMKNPLRRQLKSVPFRQHKVTMLLQSLFTGNGTTKVTLVLAAYPGHTDYTEKKILLQDMELLCGNSLISSPGNAATGLTSHKPRSFGSPSSESRSNLLGPLSRDEDESSDFGSSSFAKSDAKQLRDSATSAGSLVLAASMDEAEHTFPKPSAYAPNYSAERDEPHGRDVPLSAPVLVHEAMPRPIQTSSLFFSTTAPAVNVPEAKSRPVQSSSLFFSTTAPAFKAPETMPRLAPESKGHVFHKNPRHVSDFPGVQLPAKKEVSDPIMERTRVTSISSSSHVGGRNAAMPTSTGAGLPERDPNMPQPVLENEKAQTRRVLPNVKVARQPLARSLIENDNNRIELKPRSVNSHPSQTRAFEAISTPREKIECQKLGHSHADRSHREADRIQTGKFEAEKKVLELEKRMKELQRSKEEYEQKCRNLEQENINLKNTVKDAVTNAQSKWTKFDEEQFQKAREARIEDQTLVKKHFRTHLDRINYHYQIRNQWAMTDKPHFEIAIPSHFQRADELNMRDKMYDEKEAMALRGEENYAPPKQEIEKPIAAVEIPAKKPKRITSISQPGPLEALKRLALGN